MPRFFKNIFETFQIIQGHAIFRLHYECRMDYWAFWEDINLGWYEMYIYPFDDLYVPKISNERKLRLGPNGGQMGDPNV